MREQVQELYEDTLNFMDEYRKQNIVNTPRGIPLKEKMAHERYLAGVMHVSEQVRNLLTLEALEAEAKAKAEAEAKAKAEAEAKAKAEAEAKAKAEAK